MEAQQDFRQRFLDLGRRISTSLLCLW